MRDYYYNININNNMYDKACAKLQQRTLVHANEKKYDCSETERIRGDYSSDIEMVPKKIMLRVLENLSLLESDGNVAQLMLKLPQNWSHASAVVFCISEIQCAY